MSWRDYYRLLERYNGDLGKATKAEMASAARGNPNTPEAARRLAERKCWQDRRRRWEGKP